MSIYGDTMEALITEEDALAPFMGYSKEAEEKLQRMGVLKEDNGLNTAAIKALAYVFASGFNDCFDEFYPEDFELLDIAFDAVKSLFAEGELSGAYLYTLLCCGLIECHVPHELTWLARREDALSAYLEQFIKAMKQYEVVLEEGKEVKN